MTYKYEQINGTKTVHLISVRDKCHYSMRSFKVCTAHVRRPRDCHVCDECQRLEKKAKAKK